MSAGFSPHNMLECKGPQELRRFADRYICPASGSQRAACAAEVGALLQLIQDSFPVPASRVIQVIWAPSPWVDHAALRKPFLSPGGDGHPLGRAIFTFCSGYKRPARSPLKCQGRLPASGAGTQPCDSWNPLKLAVFAQGAKVPLHWQGQGLGSH